MGNYWIGKCWECCYPEYTGKRTISQVAKNRISRKQKKLLKRYLSSPVYKMRYYDMIDPCYCNIKRFYKEHKSQFNLLKPYYSELLKLNSKYLDGQCIATVYLDGNGRLCWYWESDDDYGGSSGIMPFCYNKEEAGNTWAYSEVKDMLYYLYRGTIKDIPEQIKSDLDLLRYIKANPVPNNWDDEDED